MAQPIDLPSLMKRLQYDPKTGIFKWLENRGGNAKVGDTAGTINADGYIQIVVDGRFHYAHRLAWAFAHSATELVEIDHRNGVPCDNRLKNLRLATSSQNKMNTVLRRDNKSGVKGVGWNKEKGQWTARLSVNGRRILHKHFINIEDAKAAVSEARAKHHGDFANGGTIHADL